MPSVSRVYSVVAILLPLVTIAVEVTLLRPYIDGHVWFLLYPSLFVSSWIGTKRAALAATAVAAIAGWWAFVPPRYTWGIEQWGDLIPTVMVGATGTMFAVFQDRSRQIAARLEELERLRYEWTSIVAHDLRQPITAILLKASGLSRHPLNDVQRRDISQIAGSAQRLNAMVNDLTDASLLDSNRIKLALGRIEIISLVREVVDRAPLASSRTTFATPPGIALFIRGDAGRLEQVLGNVLSNAVKYSDPDSEIVVGVRQTGEMAEVTVSNRGPGIPSSDLTAIFDRYVRGVYAAAKGLGLGLHIAKGLVEAHGGRIWAESVPGEITTFHIALPLDGPPVPLAALVTPEMEREPQSEPLAHDYRTAQRH